MFRYFFPDEYVKSIYEIDIDELVSKGIKGVITDLDNTLVEWDRPNATPELIDWLEKVKAKGINITIVSNNNEMRVKQFSEPLGISFISRAQKPMGKAFRQAVRQMRLNREEVVVIGDQIFTDVFGGNRSRIHTILVVPVARTDGFFTRFNRKMERIVLSKMKKKGMIEWED
ncbi:YqeG family HAD IIIA-type phosphatase [Desertibacillus haloalkaliphilus]|uniref:YqeG family HAD IIIA-type phosphatase n=1 Tax=Desertibacillus haloalkaliphilus TaxID=1328930 RepID=UPI001C258A22|nr:YqeG family HAD IIIA-type phosphatase [Desertibacillus haloalkaliphilus]